MRRRRRRKRRLLSRRRCRSGGCGCGWRRRTVVIQHGRQFDILQDDRIGSVVVRTQIAAHAIALLVVIAAPEFLTIRRTSIRHRRLSSARIGHPRRNHYTLDAAGRD